MVWTTEKPTKPGWYWRRVGIDVIVTYVDSDDLFRGLQRSGFDTGGEWAGPIPEPEGRKMP